MLSLALPDLSRRDRRPERMDQPDLDPVEHRRALRGLTRIHRVRGTEGLLWQEVEHWGRVERGRKLRLLDVACGGGDLALRIARRARRAGLRLEVAGCDRSRVAIAAARERAGKTGLEVDFFERDVLRESLPEGYDLVSSGLFLHHLADDEAVRLLRDMGAVARCAAWIDDLARSLRGWLLALFGGYLLSRSPTVHVDAPLSVRAAFTLSEAAALAERAGLAGARIKSCWPESWILTWRRA